MGKLESENEGVAQIAFQVNSLTSSSREATLPLWGGCCERQRATPRGLLLGREVTHFFYTYTKLPKITPPLYKGGGGKNWQIDTL